uniref:Zgc:172339 n=1 Tax=Cyclopterus lumpus TaxID=8103 RepID=A0A8C3G787_CYCLU
FLINISHTVQFCFQYISEVQEKLSPECKRFLYVGTPPLGLEEPNHIPVYSACTFKRSDVSKKVDVPWMYETQLSTVSDSREMQPFPSEGLHEHFEDAQAVLDDYSNSVIFERGQLNPDEHQAHTHDNASTYTLTNVVPQVREFNIGPWKNHEQSIRRRLNNYCRGTACGVTGVTTAASTLTGNAPYSERSKFPAFAAHGLNDREDNTVQEMTVQQLEDFLKRVTYVSSSFQIFYDNCVPLNSWNSAPHLP